MKMRLFGLLCAALLALGHAEDVDESAVEVLGDDNLDQFIRDNDKVLVEFYAPWCGHCKALKPNWAKAALELEGDSSVSTVLAKVDATQHQASASKFGVSGYPTIKYFDSGEVEDYNGPRDADGIVNWVKTRARPVVSKIKKKQVASFGANEDFVVIGYFKAGSKKELAFEKQAKRLRERGYLFGQVTLKKGKGRVVYTRRGFGELDGGEDLEYTGKISKLGAWLEENRLALISVIGKQSKVLPKELHTGRKALYICQKLDDFDATVEAFTATAQNLKENNIRTAFVDWSEQENFCRNNGVTEPGNIVVVDDAGNANPGNQNKYVFEGEWTDDNIAGFLSSVEEGTATRWFKSEEKPDGDDNGVEVLVGSTFLDAIQDDKSDILVEFYAPWCGHCKKYKPEYEKLARYVKRTYKNKPIRIAKVDAVNNEVDAEVKGYPTILFYPGGKDAGKMNPVKYEGNRDQDDVIDFIEENAWSLSLDYVPPKEEL